MQLYMITPKSAVDPDPDWWDKYRTKLPCQSCHLTIPQELRQTGVLVRMRDRPRDVPLACMSQPPVLIARRDFIDLFAQEIAQYLKTGPVFRENGERLPEWQSLTSEKPLLIRGGPQAIRCVCPNCGRLRYHAAGNRYAMSNDLTGQPIYDAMDQGVAVASELRVRIEKGRWKGLWVTKLAVRDEPLDGLPLTVPSLSY